MEKEYSYLRCSSPNYLAQKPEKSRKLTVYVTVLEAALLVLLF
jgi:hypothetical protein